MLRTEFLEQDENGNKTYKQIFHDEGCEYRVKAKFPSGMIGYGLPSSKEFAINWARDMQSRYPHIDHSVVDCRDIAVYGQE